MRICRQVVMDTVKCNMSVLCCLRISDISSSLSTTELSVQPPPSSPASTPPPPPPARSATSSVCWSERTPALAGGDGLEGYIKILQTPLRQVSKTPQMLTPSDEKQQTLQAGLSHFISTLLGKLGENANLIYPPPFSPPLQPDFKLYFLMKRPQEDVTQPVSQLGK